MNGRYRHRGFASLMVIALIPLLTVATMTMTWRIKQEMYHLKNQKREVEMRQLLNAGSIAAHESIDRSGDLLQVSLPESIASRASVVVWFSDEENQVTRMAIVRVTLDGAKASRTLNYGRAGQGEWILISVE